MRDASRIPEVLTLLQTAWDEFPDMRLGQLLVNVAGPNTDLFNLEDDVLLDDLREWLETSKNWLAR